MKGAPGLIGVKLDNATAEHLRKWAIYPNVFCGHVTMAYRPTPDVYAKYAPMLGKRIEFDITSMFQDDLGQAVAVHGVQSEKEVPHITVSMADGVKPSYSNVLLARPEASIYPFLKRGAGIVEFIPL
jgi:hypothetical protein